VHSVANRHHAVILFVMHRSPVHLLSAFEFWWLHSFWHLSKYLCCCSDQGYSNIAPHQNAVLPAVAKPISGKKTRGCIYRKARLLWRKI